MHEPGTQLAPSRLPAPLVALLTGAVIAGAVVVGLITTSEPLLAAGAAVAGVLVIIGACSPNVATIAVVLCLYSNIPVVLIRFWGVPKVAAQAVIGLLLIPVVHEVVLRRRGLVVHPALPLLVLFLCVQLVASTFSDYPAESFENLTEFAIEGLLIFFLITNAVRSTRVLRWATWTLLVAGVVMAGVPIYQQLTGSFGSHFGGFGQTTELGFRTGEVTGQGEVTQVRLSGTIGEQNRFAQNMLMLAPLGVMLAMYQRTRARRLAALGLSGVAAVGCALAFSRGAAVAFALTALAMVAIRLITPRQLAVAGVLALVVLACMPHYWKRLATVTDVAAVFGQKVVTAETAPDGAIRGRATEMIAAAMVYVDHPVVGVGPGMFPRYSRQYGNQLNIRRLDQSRESHSMILGLAAETGTVGTLSFLAAVLLVMHRLFVAHRRTCVRHPELSCLCGAYLAALISYLASGLFLHMSYIRFFYLMLGLGAAAAMIATAALQAEPGEPGEEGEA